MLVYVNLFTAQWGQTLNENASAGRVDCFG